MTQEPIKLQRVRIAYPDLFKPSRKYDKYGGLFVIPKDHPSIKLIKAQIKQIKEENKAKIASDKICFQDGDESENEAFHGHYTLRVNGDDPIPIFDINNDKISLKKDDEGEFIEENPFYSGCKVNGVISLWYQNNSWGKRINANCVGVRFSGDGERIGASSIDVRSALADDEDDFEDDDL